MCDPCIPIFAIAMIDHSYVWHRASDTHIVCVTHAYGPWTRWGDSASRRDVRTAPIRRLSTQTCAVVSRCGRILTAMTVSPETKWVLPPTYSHPAGRLREITNSAGYFHRVWYWMFTLSLEETRACRKMANRRGFRCFREMGASRLRRNGYSIANKIETTVSFTDLHIIGIGA